jgi:hypothetical protein
MLILAALTSTAALVIFVWVWFRRRKLFLLPSTWTLFLSLLIYVVPAVVFFDQIEELSPFATTALTYCATFILMGLATNAMLARPPALSTILLDRPSTSLSDRRVLRRGLRAVIFLLALVTTWYLLKVPLRSTGLYGVLFDPQNAAQLREESLKLLDSRALQYAYLIGFSTLSPLAFTLLLSRTAELHGLQRWKLFVPVAVFLAGYLLLTGARVGLVNLAVAGVLYAFIRNRLRVGFKPLLGAAAVLLAVPMLLSFLREQGRNEASVLEYAEAIGERIFLLPLLISGWFVEYAQFNGPVGLLAALGVGDSTDWSNVIALEFLGRKEAVTIETVTTPTAFFFSNFLYFGWLGVLPSLLALQLIDLPVRLVGRLPGPLRLPLTATMLFFSVIFVQSGFGVTLISHGYLLLILLVIAWALPSPRIVRPTLAS